MKLVKLLGYVIGLCLMLLGIVALIYSIYQAMLWFGFFSDYNAIIIPENDSLEVSRCLLGMLVMVILSLSGLALFQYCKEK